MRVVSLKQVAFIARDFKRQRFGDGNGGLGAEVEEEFFEADALVGGVLVDEEEEV